MQLTGSKRGRPSENETDTRSEAEISADGAVSPETRRLLSTILHHRYLETKSARKNDIKELAKRRAAFLRSDLDNLVSIGADKGAAVILEYFRGALYKDASFRNRAPEFLRRALEALYGQPEDATISPALAKTINHFSDFSAGARRNISDAYRGIWNIFRYAGHGTRSRKIMWSVMQIYPASNEPASSAGFKIFYQPENKPRGTVDGSILSMRGGGHMLFVGYDHTSNYPLDILAEQVQVEEGDPPVAEFQGLIKRKHEKLGPMTARVLCLRATEQHDLEKAALNIGTYREEEFRQLYESRLYDNDFKAFDRKIRNRVEHEGKFVLTL
jgi:hypothetical protein